MLKRDKVEPTSSCKEPSSYYLSLEIIDATGRKIELSSDEYEFK